jgi:hypothetical protein
MSPSRTHVWLFVPFLNLIQILQLLLSFWTWLLPLLGLLLLILIPKPGKPLHQLSSYRPISLLPIASKVFEKLLLKRLLPMVEHANLLPNHQFGFWPRHSTIEQTHHLIRVLTDTLENSQYYTAAFLDITRAFDKVWHTGLLYNLNYFLILNSYLSNRYFIVKVCTEPTGLTSINAGVPQGNVLDPLLYTYFIQLTFLPRLTPSLPPLLMILH